MPDAMALLHAQCSSCQNCLLGQTRTNLVFGVGSPTAKVLFVGEGPGEQEDLQGEPFVGKSGQLLDKYLSLIDLDRSGSKIYIANIVKCRPPQNRDPAPEEREACSVWLKRQIACIDPKIIVCLGRISATSLISPSFRITREHGQWYEIEGRRVIATYHPSALLRDVSKRPEAFADFREIRTAMRSLGHVLDPLALTSDNTQKDKENSL